MDSLERSVKIREHILKQAKEENEREAAKQQEEMKRLELTELPTEKPQFNHPDSLENDEATILYVVAMVVSTIFRGNWILWIIWTIIWLKYINRHN